MFEGSYLGDAQRLTHFGTDAESDGQGKGSKNRNH